MRKINPVQKFFQDYPIIWVAVLILAIAISLVYLLAKPRSEPPKEPETKIESRVKKPEREVKVTPVAIPMSFPRSPKFGGIRPDESRRLLAEKRESRMLDPRFARVTSKIVSPAFGGIAMTGVQKPKIAFVIDDLGYNKRQTELLFSIDRPLTIAILPQLAHSKYFLEEGKRHGFVTILHQPLQPENPNEDPGPGLITTDMNAEQIHEILEKNLSTVPGVIGVNNHMGSQSTRDRRVMYLLAKEFKERNLFFLDSLTHSQSIAHEVTFALGIPTTKRDVFLDNEDDYQMILERVRETAEIAKQKGSAVAIGHFRKNTLEAIKDMMPKLEAEGFEFVTLKELVK